MGEEEKQSGYFFCDVSPGSSVRTTKTAEEKHPFVINQPTGGAFIPFTVVHLQDLKVNL